jgi:NAD-dependent SIR2 family protein deacetylase
MSDDAVIERIAAWIAEAPRVLIGAGAGLSVAAGIDYTDTVSFAELYPGMTRHGYSACYELIGRHDLPPEVFWGYWALHARHARFSAHTMPVYEALRTLTADKDVFVVTSNVDALFTRHGFDGTRVWTPQGDFAHLHCTARRRPECADLVWASQPIVETLLRHVDPATQAVTDASVIPRCPACGGSVFFNVREDATFVETPYAEDGHRCADWIRSAADGPLLVLEIGAGFNTPGVVRFPLERLAVRHPLARFVRINREHPAVPPALGDRGIGVGRDAGEVVRMVWRNRERGSS